MSIQLKEIRIRNFKCFENLNVNFKNNSLLLGANNVGKTTLLEAIELSLTMYKKVNKEMVFLGKNEELSDEKTVIIDVLIESQNEEFEEEWIEHFGAILIDGERDSVGIRTIIKYNDVKGEYELEKKAMNHWPEIYEVENFTDFNSHPVTKYLLDAIPVYYLDANRDIIMDIGNQYSYWGKLTSDIEIKKEQVDDIEQSLKELGQNIIDNSEILRNVTEKLNGVTRIMDSANRYVEINPITQKIRDINKGMQIKIGDEYSESFSIDNLGMGTRSWTTFLTLSAYIDFKKNEMKEKQKPFFPILLLEEPESHLHPQAQRKIYLQIKNLIGQKFISTHSPVVAAQVELDEILHVYKNGSSSGINSINLDSLSKNEIRKIKGEVIKSRGDLLFANKVILCEGETEEQAIPIFYKEFYKHECFEAGVNIIGVDGSGKYKPFLQICKDLGIQSYILSDGELSTKKEIKKFYSNIFDNDACEDLIERHVVFLPENADFENYLINEGYQDELLEVIDEIKNEKNYIHSYIENNHNKKAGRNKTNEICSECEQNIFVDIIRDYSGSDGFRLALIDILHNNKTEYSSLIANKIIKRSDNKKIPTALKCLFNKMDDRGI